MKLTRMPVMYPKVYVSSINQLLWQWEINNIDHGPKRSAQTGFFLLLHSCTYMHLKSFFVLVIFPVCLCGCEGGWGQWMTNWLGFLHNSRSSVHCMLPCVCGATARGTQPQLNSSDSNVMFACRVQTCRCLSWGHTGCEDDWQGDCNLSHNVPSHTCIYVRT